MSKRSAKAAGPITRRQQVESLRRMKAQEVAASAEVTIRDAVRQVVEEELKKVKDTMLNLIDRVVDLECTLTDEAVDDSNGDDRQAGTEAPKVPEGDEVAPGPVAEGTDSGSPNPGSADAGGRLRSQGVRGDLHC